MIQSTQALISKDFVIWETFWLMVTHHNDDIYVAELFAIWGTNTKVEGFLNLPIYCVSQGELSCLFINPESFRITIHKRVFYDAVQIRIISFHSSDWNPWICLLRETYCWEVFKHRGSIIDILNFQLDLEQ